MSVCNIYPFNKDNQLCKLGRDLVHICFDVSLNVKPGLLHIRLEDEHLSGMNTFDLSLVVEEYYR